MQKTFRSNDNNNKQLVANVDLDFHRLVKSYACSKGKTVREYIVDLIIKDLRKRGIKINE